MLFIILGCLVILGSVGMWYVLLHCPKSVRDDREERNKAIDLAMLQMSIAKQRTYNRPIDKSFGEYLLVVKTEMYEVTVKR